MAGTDTQLIEAWLRGWDTHDIEGLIAVFSDDCMYEDVPTGVVNKGQGELRTFAQAWLSAVPDAWAKLVSSCAAGGHGAAEWEFGGTHRGDLPGMPASGRTMVIRGQSAFDFADGKIKRCCDYWDLAAVLRQLGFMTAP